MYGPPRPAVLPEDIYAADQRIRTANESVPNIGIHQNQGQMPVSEFGEEDTEWVVRLKGSEYVGGIDFRWDEWARSRETEDTVMELLLNQVQEEAMRYEGLKIDSYIRQGSSREGLKVVAPDEYDTILEFHIESLESHIHQSRIQKHGQLVPGFCFMTVKNKTMVNFEENFPALFKEGVFVEKDSFIYLSSKALHQTELNSMFDCACSKLVKQISAFKNKRKLTIFSLKSERNPPAITLTICLVQNEAHQVLITQGHSRITASVTKEIDVDVVPAILLRLDNDTYYNVQGNKT